MTTKHDGTWVGDWPELKLSASPKMLTRFTSKVDRRNSEQCWLWTASRDRDGYGRFQLGDRCQKAHRVSYSLFKGAIPAGMEIDHLCHTHACVNPAHLRVTTRKQNGENRAGPLRRNTSKALGVSYVKREGRWMARVMHNGKRHYLGHFDSKDEAEQAAREARLRLFTHNDVDRRAS